VELYKALLYKKYYFWNIKDRIFNYKQKFSYRLFKHFISLIF